MYILGATGRQGSKWSFKEAVNIWLLRRTGSLPGWEKGTEIQGKGKDLCEVKAISKNLC